MKKWMIIPVILIVGCAATSNGPVIDPNAVTGIEGVAQGLVDTGRAMAPLWPVGGMIATGIAGWLAMWRKGKKPLMEAKTQSELNYATGSTIVWAIEQLKKDNPKAWDALKAKIGGIRDDLPLSAETKVAMEQIIKGMINESKK